MNIEIRNGYLITPQEDTITVEKRDLFIENGIVKFSKTFSVADKIIEANNRVVFPGLVNAHHHFYSCLSKGIPAEVPFRDFTGTLQKLWWKLDRALNETDVKLSTVLSLHDCIRNGVTTVFDHHISASFIENSLDTMKNVFADYDLNGVLSFEISNRNGEEIFRKSLEENIRFCQENEKNENCKGMIGMHASFTLDNENLRQIAEETGNFPIHLHVAEGEIDEISCLEKYGKTIVERLLEFGLLRRNSLLIHGSNLSDKEVELLKNKQIYLVQAIDSNLNNALKVADISRLINENIKTTVGTDGMHSNTMKAWKNSFLFTKYQNQNPDIGFPEMQALFLNSYRLKKDFGFPLGILENDPADLAIFDYQPATPFDTNTFLGHFIYGITETPARWVLKKDKILLDDFQLKTNEKYEELIDKRVEISQKLFARFEKM